MKTTTALALVSAVSGAVIEQRQTPTPEFDVTNFSANCQPHSVLCFFSFNVATTTTPASATSCSITVQGPDFLPAVGLTGCEDSRFSWSFEPRDGGAHAVTVNWESAPSFNQTGSHLVQPADVVREDHGSVVTERYVGPASFVISPLQSIP
ncbi:hypersensitive response-inducing protein [Apiospora phragmitis]|uniref:Hypersensitive response-inducing protein n=1 Tax=Apiospora phragmitis TaxID=2905665 RepID=A0ABR1USX9_9PEZI